MRNVSGVWAAVDVLTGQRSYLPGDRQQGQKNRKQDDSFEKILDEKMEGLNRAKRNREKPKRTEKKRTVFI